MKRVYFANCIEVDAFINERYGEDADSKSVLHLTDEEFKTCSTGVAYNPMNFFKDTFNFDAFCPDPENFYCRVIDDESVMTNYYMRLKELEIECMNDVISLLEKCGGCHTFTDDSLVLSEYNSNYDITTSTTIKRIEISVIHDSTKYIAICTEDGRWCRQSDFIDGSIIAIYEALHAELYPLS